MALQAPPARSSPCFVLSLPPQGGPCLCTVRALVATAQPRLNAAATAAAPTLALDHVAPLSTRLSAGMVDDAFVIDLRARVNDPSKEHLLTSLKRHANEVRTRLRSGACRVSGMPIPVERAKPARG